MDKKVICFGEVLWDLLPSGARVGGAPLNVCYHLHQLHIDSQIISQIGEDKLGDDLNDELQSLGVDTRFCAVSKDYPTSRVEVSLDEKGKPQYTIVEQVAWDYISYAETVAQAIQEADIFVFGSLAARNQHSRQTLKAYLEHSKYTVMDVNLRAPFYHASHILELLHQVDCLKINDEELVLLEEWLEISHGSEHENLEKILSFYPRLKEVILTKGSDGAIYYSRNKNVNVPAYAIAVNDTVGAGDAFLAGFLAYMLKDKSVEESLELASLLSAYVATKAGACPNYTTQDLEQFKLIHAIYD